MPTTVKYQVLDNEGLKQLTKTFDDRYYGDPFIYKGATTTKRGIQGAVPVAETTDVDHVLFGDGTWGQLHESLTNIDDIVTGVEIDDNYLTPAEIAAKESTP